MHGTLVDEIRIKLRNAIYEAAGQLGPALGIEMVVDECNAFLDGVAALVARTRRDDDAA